MPTLPPTFRPPWLPDPAEVARASDHRRGSARDRGYTVQWDKASIAYRHEHPICEACRLAGLIGASEVTDHVVPHRGNPGLFWDRANWQACCRWHHDVVKQRLELLWVAGKIEREALHLTHPFALSVAAQVRVDYDKVWRVGPDGVAELVQVSAEVAERRRPSSLLPSAIPLTIVTGATASGKSTHVRSQAHADDIVVDLDAIMQRIAGREVHAAGERWLTPAMEERNRQLASLATSSARAAWFIIAAPAYGDRVWWSRQLGGEVLVMPTSEAECIRRVYADPARRGHEDRMAEAIRTWFHVDRLTRPQEQK